MRQLRYQLRRAWAMLGCRCAFNRHHIITIVDSHCPIHGWSGQLDDPEGWENVKP